MRTEQSKDAVKFAITSKDSNVGTWCLDMVYNHLYWSDETYCIFDIPKERFLPYYGTFYNRIHPDDREIWTTHWELFIEGAVPMNIQHRIVLGTGEIRYVHQLGERIVDLQNHLTWIRGTVRDITGSRIVKKDAPRGSNLKDVTKRSLLTRVARIGRAVSALFRKSGSVIVDLTSELIKLPKIVITGNADDLHLKSAIEALLSRLTVAKPMTISFDTGMFYERGLSKKVKLSILRVIQEQFTNIVKYANASEVYVSLRRTRQRAYLVIHDNGQGFDMTQKRNGLFITDIIECVEMNNGQATIKSEQGVGCQLRAEFSTKLPTGRPKNDR
jgi:two-component sensor histidine kinase